MGVERFRNEYDIPNLKQVILSEKKRQFPEMSDAGYLGMTFADFGAEGLRETQEEISLKEKAHLINISSPHNINRSYLNKLGDNYSAVIVGTILEFMAGAIKQGVFDKPGYVREHNTRIKGSKYYYPLYSHPWETQVIKNEYWEQMRRLAEENPTLSAFFTTGYHLMPYFIQEHIVNVGSLEFIIERTLPIYHSVASRLLTSS